MPARTGQLFHVSASITTGVDRQYVCSIPASSRCSTPRPWCKSLLQHDMLSSSRIFSDLTLSGFTCSLQHFWVSLVLLAMPRATVPRPTHLQAEVQDAELSCPMHCLLAACLLENCRGEGKPWQGSGFSRFPAFLWCPILVTEPWVIAMLWTDMWNLGIFSRSWGLQSPTGETNSLGKAPETKAALGRNWDANSLFGDGEGAMMDSKGRREWLESCSWSYVLEWNAQPEQQPQAPLHRVRTKGKHLKNDTGGPAAKSLRED